MGKTVDNRESSLKTIECLNSSKEIDSIGYEIYDVFATYLIVLDNCFRNVEKIYIRKSWNKKILTSLR